MTFLQVKRKIAYRILGSVSVLIFIGACSSAPVKIFGNDPIQGIWRLGDGRDYVEIDRCDKESVTLCGKLIAFAGGPDSRDYMTNDLMKWGSLLCQSLIVSHLKEQKVKGTYQGQFYDYSTGESYSMMLSLVNDFELTAWIYMGASEDEGIDWAVNSLSSGLDIYSSVSFLVRSTLGKEHLGERSVWRRSINPVAKCGHQL